MVDVDHPHGVVRLAHLVDDPVGADPSGVQPSEFSSQRLADVPPMPEFSLGMMKPII
jgi:hypothetical protein